MKTEKFFAPVKESDTILAAAPARFQIFEKKEAEPTTKTQITPKKEASPPPKDETVEQFLKRKCREAEAAAATSTTLIQPKIEKPPEILTPPKKLKISSENKGMDKSTP